MRFCLLLFTVTFFSACSLNEEKKLDARIDHLDSITTTLSTDSNAATQDTAPSLPLPRTEKVRTPHGLYSTYIEDQQMEQIISFNSDLTYELQEHYRSDKKDSTIRVTGTWTPSDGMIWLYKDQIVRGRYKWKGDTLLAINPGMEKNLVMYPLADVLGNKAWAEKQSEGIRVYAIGTEPFWSVEYNSKDTISFALAEWARPEKFRVTATRKSGDSTFYLAKNDSVQIRLVVLPYFCNDGMSDLIYRNRVDVAYKSQVYSGCGTAYK